MRTVNLSLTLTLLLCLSFFSQAQVPQGVNYQAIAQDASGKTLDGQPIRVKIVLRESSATGAASGSDNNGSTAPLRIQSNTQRMLIDGNEIDSNVDLFVNHNNSNDVYMVTGGGRVGIGTFNPRSYLHVVHNAADWGGDSGFRLENEESYYAWVFYTDEEGDLNLYSKDARFNATAFKGRFVYSSGTYQKMSDARLKKNVTSLENVLSQVLQLTATTYHYVDHPDTAQRSLGFIAQEVQLLFPELVSHSGGEEDFMSLDYDGFGVLAIKAIQEQQAMIKQLKQRIEMLEQQLKP